jgi:hypothetical protein
MITGALLAMLSITFPHIFVSAGARVHVRRAWPALSIAAFVIRWKYPAAGWQLTLNRLAGMAQSEYPCCAA